MTETHGGPKRKSARQVRFLLSKGSPLTARQKRTLERELHEGTVKMLPSIRRPD